MPALTRLGLKKQLQREKEERALAARREQAEKRRQRERERQRARRIQEDAAAVETPPPSPPKGKRHIHRDTLVSAFQLLDYTDLMNCQLVSRRWNAIIQNEERILPIFTSDGAVMTTDAHEGWGVSSEPGCEVTCSQRCADKGLAKTLVGQSPLVDAQEQTVRLQMSVPRRVRSVPPGAKKRRSSSAALETTRVFTVHCGVTLSQKLLLPVLHWLRHLRDHQFYFKSVTLCPFRMELWRASVFRDSRHADVIRCRKLTLQSVTTRGQREWAREISTTCVRHCKVLRWEVEWAEFDDLLWLADFILRDGAATGIPKFVVDNDQAEQSFIDVVCRRFEELESVDGLFPDVYLPCLDQMAHERDLMVGNLLRAEKSDDNFDVLVYAFTNNATKRRLLISMKAKCRNLALARKFSVAIRLEPQQ